MKKKLLSLSLLMIRTCSLFADAQTSDPSPQNATKQSFPEGILLEFRPSYFYPISKGIRQAFHNGGVNY